MSEREDWVAILRRWGCRCEPVVQAPHLELDGSVVVDVDHEPHCPILRSTQARQN